METKIKKTPSFSASFIVITVSLLIMIVGTVGLKLAPEILLLVIALLAAIYAMTLGYSWADLEEAISERLKTTMPVIMMIWCIGMVVGTFMYSGTIPMVIYYGLKVISPQYVILSAFLACIVFSTVTGSSWSSAGTAGVAFMGVAAGLGVPLHITAGAIISGAIFGDKLSPLSETTNLAPLCAGAQLYDHIKSMMWTTLPPAIIAGIVYYIVGLKYKVPGATVPQETVEIINGLGQVYNWSILLLIPFLIVLYGAIFKKPTVPTLFCSSLSAIIVGMIVQKFPLAIGFRSAVRGFSVDQIFQGELSADVLKLLNRGGIYSMVSVVIIVFCGYSFAAIISKAGILETVLRPVISKVKNVPVLILSTLLTVLAIFLATGSAYVAFILVPEIYRKKYIDFSVAPRILSRSLEDIGTVMGSLIPWTSSVAFYTASLGIDVFGPNGYAPWSILSYLSPLFAILWAVTGIGIKKLSPLEQEESLRAFERSY